jgi:energy-converting hydrogenase B subunit Q
MSDIATPSEQIGLMVEVRNGPGVLHLLTGVIFHHGGDITSVTILDSEKPIASVFFEIAGGDSVAAIEEEMRRLEAVRSVERTNTLQKVYGKRIIIMGGGAQVGQVAIGAISEADRHNIRGERISVDTIPLVGERTLADAVRAVVHLPRAKALVLAGALMGGEIRTAVCEVREKGCW